MLNSNVFMIPAVRTSLCEADTFNDTSNTDRTQRLEAKND